MGLMLLYTKYFLKSLLGSEIVEPRVNHLTNNRGVYMFKVSLVLTLVFGLFSAAAIEKAPTKSGNYCLDQAIEILDNQFGAELEIQKVSKTKYNNKYREFWIRTNMCQGSFVTTSVRSQDCKIAHYGEVPNYISNFYATGECDDLMD